MHEAGAPEANAPDATASEGNAPDANALETNTPEANAPGVNTRKTRTHASGARQVKGTSKDARAVSTTAPRAAARTAPRAAARTAPRAVSTTTTRAVSTTAARVASTTADARAGSSVPPGVAVIGAGRLGSALALALSQSGYPVVALVARRAARARLVARRISPRPLALAATELDSLPDTVGLILVTTPDDQIAQVAARLAAVPAARGAQPSRRRRRVALHASGALLSDALAPLGQHNFSLGSLHPLVSISDPAGGARNLRGAFYCLEGEAHALAAARKIVRALGGRHFSVAARDKALYHASAVIASGHTVALFSLAADLLARCGLGHGRAREVLLPLLASTLDNLRAHAPDEALTGTFARADLSTVGRHLAALRDVADARGAIAIYALLGERSLQLAARRHKFDPSIVAQIARLLREASGASHNE
ncbi:MAG TPA: DUF2520 domain-containing protein [Pyrinomonadaceae bacterium]|nr:DUF2520 domain-containing protein [Pyrinomonadaceae bacterium]